MYWKSALQVAERVDEPLWVAECLYHRAMQLIANKDFIGAASSLSEAEELAVQAFRCALEASRQTSQQSALTGERELLEKIRRALAAARSNCPRRDRVRSVPKVCVRGSVGVQIAHSLSMPVCLWRRCCGLLLDWQGTTQQRLREKLARRQKADAVNDVSAADQQRKAHQVGTSAAPAEKRMKKRRKRKKRARNKRKQASAKVANAEQVRSAVEVATLTTAAEAAVAIQSQVRRMLASNNVAQSVRAAAALAARLKAAKEAQTAAATKIQSQVRRMLAATAVQEMREHAAATDDEPEPSDTGWRAKPSLSKWFASTTHGSVVGSQLSHASSVATLREEQPQADSVLLQADGIRGYTRSLQLMKQVGRYAGTFHASCPCSHVAPLCLCLAFRASTQRPRQRSARPW